MSSARQKTDKQLESSGVYDSPLLPKSCHSMRTPEAPSALTSYDHISSARRLFANAPYVAPLIPASLNHAPTNSHTAAALPSGTANGHSLFAGQQQQAGASASASAQTPTPAKRGLKFSGTPNGS